MQPPEYKPRSVRELLTEMKDTSDLMVDLAYAVLLYESEELANLVHSLEKKMDELMYTIRIMAAVAARNVREAHKITGILQVASSAEAISNATGDMADLIRMGIGIHPVIKDALRAADEKIVMVEVSAGTSLGERLKLFIELAPPEIRREHLRALGARIREWRVVDGEQPEPEVVEGQLQIDSAELSQAAPATAEQEPAAQEEPKSLPE